MFGKWLGVLFCLIGVQAFAQTATFPDVCPTCPLTGAGTITLTAAAHANYITTLDCTGGDTVTVPSAVSTDFPFFLKRTNSAAGDCTIDPATTETIDGATTYVLTLQDQYVWFMSNGANWVVFGKGWAEDAGAANNFLTAISKSGLISRAQPSASNLSDGTTGTGGAVVLATAPVLSAKNLNGIRFADQFAGGDFGAQVNAAITDAGTGGIVEATNFAVGVACTTDIAMNQVGTTLYLPAKYVPTGAGACEILGTGNLISIIGLPGKTLIEPAAGWTGIAINVDPPTGAIEATVENIRCDLGNATAQICFAFTDTIVSLLRNIYVEDADKGVTVTNSSYLTIQDVYLLNPRTNSLDINCEGGCEHNIRGVQTFVNSASVTALVAYKLTRTTTTDTGGIYFTDVRAGRNTAGTLAGGFSFTSSVPSTPQFLFCVRCLADNLVGDAMVITNLLYIQLVNTYLWSIGGTSKSGLVLDSVSTMLATNLLLGSTGTTPRDLTILNDTSAVSFENTQLVGNTGNNIFIDDGVGKSSLCFQIAYFGVADLATRINDVATLYSVMGCAKLVKTWIPAATCVGGVAANNWDDDPVAAEPAAACVGATVGKAYSDFSDAATNAFQVHLKLAADWTPAGGMDAKYVWLSGVGNATLNVRWQMQTICVADGETADPAFNTASGVTDADKATTDQLNDATITGVTITGCLAGELMFIRVFRNPADAADTLGGTARLVGVELTNRRVFLQ